MNRCFVLITSLNDVVNEPGIHSRALVSSLLISRSIRRDTVFILLLREGYAIYFYGNRIKQLRADESSAFGIINKSLKFVKDGREGTPHSGVYVKKLSIDKVLNHRYVCRICSELSKLPKVELSKLSTPFIYVTAYPTFKPSEIDLLRTYDFRSIEGTSNLLPEQEFVVVNNIFDNL